MIAQVLLLRAVNCKSIQSSFRIQLQCDCRLLFSLYSQSLHGGWVDVNADITREQTATISLPEIEAALSSLEEQAAADVALLSDDVLPAEETKVPETQSAPVELPEDLLKALENPYAAAMEEESAHLG